MVKTKKKFIGYINEMGGLGLLNFTEYNKVKKKIKNHPHLR